ncbi:MAG TPA: ORF6N domain-containing protein [Cytophagaceae bacterium]|jgi:hypothetical protein|nr:ORF6N domain-containing protein [Cytophagaceae bacterium]
MAKNNKTKISDDVVVNKIHLIRGQKVMLDSDLAEMYGVETKRLKEQVRRNATRFPKDFMFELTKKEVHFLRSQIATLENSQHYKYLPFVFTEHGVLMLSSILNSERAIEVNIQIMRIYTKLKEILLTHKDILLKVEQMEKNLGKQDEKIKAIFDYLKQFIKEKNVPIPKIGFKRSNEK